MLLHQRSDDRETQTAAAIAGSSSMTSTFIGSSADARRYPTALIVPADAHLNGRVQVGVRGAVAPFTRPTTDQEREPMNTRKKILVAGAGIVALAAAGTGVALATGVADDDEKPITGEALTRASDAALEHTGEGRVTETEVGDEDSYYEVEVNLDDGRQVDVQLDENFVIVDTMADDESPDDQD